jgi:hypothetical protein
MFTWDPVSLKSNMSVCKQYICHLVMEILWKMLVDSCNSNQFSFNLSSDPDQWWEVMYLFGELLSWCSSAVQVVVRGDFMDKVGGGEFCDMFLFVVVGCCWSCWVVIVFVLVVLCIVLSGIC